jgi:hypothetical protein
MAFVRHVTSTKSHCQHVLISLSSPHIVSTDPRNGAEGHAMPLDLFSRKLVLLVEDEPLIALDVERDLRTAGARVIAAGYLDAALCMTEHPDLSGAVVDLRLGADSAMLRNPSQSGH